MSKTYDSKCHELAKEFLEDAKIDDEAVTHRLAQEIQTTIEDFIDEELG